MSQIKQKLLEEIAIIAEDWKSFAVRAAAGLAVVAVLHSGITELRASQVKQRAYAAKEQRNQQERLTEIKRKEEQESGIRRQCSEYVFKRDIEELNQIGAQLQDLEKRLYGNKKLSKKDSLILEGNFKRINQYIPLIKERVDYFNAKFNFPEPLKLIDVCAILAKEAGSGASFYKDPMQVANEGDDALRIFQNNEQDSWEIDYIPEITGIKNTQIENWKRTYDSNMNNERSIKTGIACLVLKARIRDKNKRIIGWRSWEDATERYNGNGDPQYLAKIEKIKEKIGVID